MRLLVTTTVLLVSSLALAKQKIEAVPGEFLVKLKSTNQKLSAMTVEQQLNVSFKSVVNKTEKLVVVRTPMIETSESAVQRLQNNPMVEYVEPNYIYHAFKAPNDTDYSKLWGMHNSGQVDPKGQQGVAGFDIKAEEAWNITTGSKDVVVAVIDTGIDYTIDDLKENIWTNEKEIPANGIDDDKNGFVDDIHGYNFVDNKGDAKDDHAHGSHCAGTIGASGDNGKGVVGVNWHVKMMPVKFLSAQGSGTLEDAVKSIDYATQMGANIMSNSWGGGGFSQALLDAIKRAAAKNILFVAAAGNDGVDNDADPHYPSSYDVENVLAVAAIDNRGSKASFSNWGKKSVHVAAPGVNIWSTTPAGLQSFSGTSMATPHVSGVAALLKSHEPALSAVQLKERLVATVHKIPSMKGKVVSGGLVNAYAALMNEVEAPDPNDPGNWPSQPYQLSSEHPYKPMSNKTFTVSVPGAKMFAIKFSKFETENGYDKVKFVDAAGKTVDEWTGNHNGDTTAVFTGDSATLILTSDNSVEGYGFDIDSIAIKQ